jgi:hypothetical protein
MPVSSTQVTAEPAGLRLDGCCRGVSDSRRGWDRDAPPGAVLLLVGVTLRWGS